MDPSLPPRTVAATILVGPTPEVEDTPESVVRDTFAALARHESLKEALAKTTRRNQELEGQLNIERHRAHIMTAQALRGVCFSERKAHPEVVRAVKEQVLANPDAPFTDPEILLLVLVWLKVSCPPQRWWYNLPYSLMFKRWQQEFDKCRGHNPMSFSSIARGSVRTCFEKIEVSLMIVAGPISGADTEIRAELTCDMADQERLKPDRFEIRFGACHIHDYVEDEERAFLLRQLELIKAQL